MSESNDAHDSENDPQKTDRQEIDGEKSDIPSDTGTDTETGTNGPTTSRRATNEDPTDPPRETTPGRGQGQGSWLEDYTAETLEEWGYRTQKRVKLLALEADVVAQRKELQNDPDDYLIVQCKDWDRKPIQKEAIIRLCFLAFVGRAMPVLCHTSRLTQQAWELAQAYDVRLLNLNDLEYDQLPPLTTYRPPSGTKPHRRERDVNEFRSSLPALLWGCRRSDADLEGPVWGNPNGPPCYVADRMGHADYVLAHEVDYTFYERDR